MFDEARAIRAIGALGSIESLAPALAPILGAWLLALGGWDLSFQLIGAVAVALAATSMALPLIPQASRRPRGSYAALLRDRVYLRYALSQAFVLGGLLVFVFGAPVVFVRSFGGTLADFIVMQVVGVTAFILAANAAASLAARFGVELMITSGTALAAAGAAALLTYALAGGTSALAVTALFVPVGIGLGLRGPQGFYRAVLASRGDDARGSALVILAVMAAAAGGTAAVAPSIGHGLAPLTAAAFVLELAALACLVLLPRLETPA
jgi:predicted MFS family arabinose efflux permease